MNIRITLAAVAAGALVAAGCGGDDEGGGGGEAQEGPTTVRVGLLPLAAVAPIYIGVDQGFFEQEGLRVEPQLAQGGAAVVPAVVSGDFEFGYSNNVSLLLASSQGLPLEIINEGNQEAEQVAQATDGLVVDPEGATPTLEDLAGATIGVNTLENVGEVAIKTALEGRGVDVSGLEFVEIPFPDMVPAVASGRIDAGWVVEPFVQAAEAEGLETLANPFFDTAPRLSLGTYFASDQYIAENPDVVERFTRALNRSFEFTQQNPDVLRASVGEFTEIPDEAAAQMNLPQFSTELNVESIRLQAERMQRYGIVEEVPDLSELISQGG